MRRFSIKRRANLKLIEFTDIVQNSFKAFKNKITLRKYANVSKTAVYSSKVIPKKSLSRNFDEKQENSINPKTSECKKTISSNEQLSYHSTHLVFQTQEKEMKIKLEKFNFSITSGKYFYFF